VKKVIGYILLLAFLATGTEFYQLAKLPVLFSHYSEHQAEDENMTLSEFLQMHFFDPLKVDHDYGRDIQLPFKNHECSQHVDYLKVYTRKTHTDQHPHFSQCTDSFCIPSTAELPTRSCFAEIWNPPKI
jgi:hypothetical protein